MLCIIVLKNLEGAAGNGMVCTVHRYCSRRLVRDPTYTLFAIHQRLTRGHVNNIISSRPIPMSCLSAVRSPSSSFLLTTHALITATPSPGHRPKPTLRWLFASLIVCPATWERWEILIRRALPLDVFLFALCICFRGESVPEFLAWLLLHFRIDMGESSTPVQMRICTTSRLLELFSSWSVRNSLMCSLFSLPLFGLPSISACVIYFVFSVNSSPSHSPAGQKHPKRSNSKPSCKSTSYVIRDASCPIVNIIWLVLRQLRFFIVGMLSSGGRTGTSIFWCLPYSHNGNSTVSKYYLSSLDCRIRITAKYILLNDPTTRKWTPNPHDL
jgi:hypothetical protein